MFHASKSLYKLHYRTMLFSSSMLPANENKKPCFFILTISPWEGNRTKSFENLLHDKYELLLHCINYCCHIFEKPNPKPNQADLNWFSVTRTGVIWVYFIKFVKNEIKGKFILLHIFCMFVVTFVFLKVEVKIKVCLILVWIHIEFAAFCSNKV